MIEATQPHYAGFARRLVAALIDTLILSLVLELMYLLFWGHGNMRLVAVDGNVQLMSEGGWLDNLFFLLATIVLWVKYGGTPGKLLMGCHVIDLATGKYLTPGKALLRYLAYFVSALPLGLGFFWIIWDKRKQGFHDKIAKTVVVVEHISWGKDESQKNLQQLLQELR